MLKTGLISVGIGIGIAILPFVLGAMVGFPLESKWDGILTAIMWLNYWPSLLLRPPITTLDCRSADTIANKLSCIWLSLGISALAYSAMSFVALQSISKLRRTSSL